MSSSELASHDWEGIHRDTANEQEDGSVLVHISYTSAPWLFSQIAAAAGTIVIEEPKSLKNDFRTWAKSLL